MRFAGGLAIVAAAVVAVSCGGKSGGDICGDAQYSNGVCDPGCKRPDPDCDDSNNGNSDLRPPNGFSASDDVEGAIFLTWDELSSEQADGYRIYRAHGTMMEPDMSSTHAQIDGSASYYQDTQVETGNCYVYAITALLAGEESAPSDAARGCAALPSTSLGTPQDVTATAFSASEVSVSWSPVTGAVQYTVFRSPSNDVNNRWEAGLTTQTTLLDEQAFFGSNYYWVQARDALGENSELSTPVFVDTAQSPPAIPKNLHVSWASGGLRSVWQSSMAASSYTLYRADAVDGTYASVYQGSVAEYVDPVGADGAVYYYKVDATNAYGTSPMGVAVMGQTPPAQPEAPTVDSIDSDSVTLSWTAVPSATSYALLRHVGSGSMFYAQAEGIVQTTFTESISDLNDGADLAYRLIAYNGGGESQPGPAVFTTVPYPIDAPTGLTASTDVMDQVDLSWDAVTDATGYTIYRSTSTAWEGTALASDVTGTSYSDTSAVPGTTYYYRVQTLGAIGASGLSDPVGGSADYIASTTSISITKLQPWQFYITWATVTDATGYYLYRSTAETPLDGYEEVIGPMITPEMVDTPPLTSVTYYYRIQTRSPAGHRSQLSDVFASDSIDVALSAPNGVHATVDEETQITVSWNALTGADYYRVYRSDSSNGTYVQVGGDITALFFVDADRPGEVDFYYKVRGYESDGDPSADSTPTFGYALFATTHSEVTTGWTAPSGFIDPVDIATDASGNLYVLDDGTAPSHTDRGVYQFDSAGSSTGLRYGTLDATDGVGDGELNYALGITVDEDGSVLIADRHFTSDASPVPRDCVQRFDGATGGFLALYGSNGAGNGQLAEPFDVAVDSSSNIYVVERANNRIHKLTSDGTYVTKWGSAGTGNGEFDGPEGIAVDSQDNVYVADFNNDRVQKFSSDGTFLASWSANAYWSPRSIAVGSSGEVFVIGGTNAEGRVRQYDADGNMVGVFGGRDDGSYGYIFTTAVAADSLGFVYVLYADGVIKKFAP